MCSDDAHHVLIASPRPSDASSAGDYAGRDRVLLFTRDELAHQSDQLVGEQRVSRDVVDSECDAVADGDVCESGLFDLVGEVTLRQGTGNSTGPRRLARQYLWWQIALHGEVGDAQPATRPQHPAHLGERPGLSRREVEHTVRDDDVDGLVRQWDRFHLAALELR